MKSEAVKGLLCCCFGELVQNPFFFTPRENFALYFPIIRGLGDTLPLTATKDGGSPLLVFPSH